MDAPLPPNEGARLEELRRVEESLAAVSAWQRAILDSAGVSIIATDPQGVIQTFNAAAERMLGYRAEEVVGKTTPMIIHHPEEVQRRAAELTRELGRVIEPGFEAFVAKTRSGTPEEREWTYVRKDGSRFPVRLSVTAMVDAAGRLTGFMGIAADLTERKREEERFRLVVEAAPNGIVIVNEAGVITFVNAQTEKLFGYTWAELAGQPVEVLVPERFRASHPAQHRGFFADPKARPMGAGRDLFGRRKDGSEFPVEIGLSPIVTREGNVVLAAVVDITERKRVDAQLKEQTRLAAFTAEVGLVLTRKDPLPVLLRLCADAFVHHLDAAFARIWTLNEAQAVLELQASAGLYTHVDGPHGRVPVGQFKIGLIAEKRRPHLTNAVIGDPRVGDQEWARREGMVAFAGYPLIVEDRLLGVMAMFARQPLSASCLEAMAAVAHGIALSIERKRMEESLRARNEELRIATEQAQAADRIKSAFLATMSHELRTPLNSIIGFTGIILQGLAGPLNPEQSKQLEMVRGSARHLLALINDVLDISKIEAGQLAVVSEPFDVRASITKVSGIVAPLAEKKGLELHTQLAAELGEIVGDQRRVEQILLNLLNNAVKFTERGEVALAAEIVPGAIRNAQSAIRISVSDTGMGIKPEDMATLFQPFRQIDSGLSRNHEGTGLGLAICRRLADLMGGEICAESEWGKGSVFTFTLPLTGAMHA